MQEQQICCCGSSGWTRVIAWFEIVVAVVVGVQVYRGLVDLPTTESNYGFVVGILIFLLVLVAVSVLMAVILWNGSINKNPRQIKAWMRYTVFCMFLSIYYTFRQLTSTSNTSYVAANLVSQAFGILIQMFFLWVVGIHKEEIESAAKIQPVAV